MVTLYGIGLISLSIVGRNLIVVLRTHYPEFYFQERKMILSMIIILIVAMIFKVIFGSIRIYLSDRVEEFFRDSEANDDWISPTW